MTDALIDLDAVIQAAANLEPLPPAATRLATILSAENWDIGDLLQVVSFDPALTGKLLRVANSPVFGGRQRISSTDAAVVRLGPGAILSLAVGSCVGKRMRQPVPGYGLGGDDLWRHSVAAALAADRMRRHCEAAIPAESFATAMLHDVGKMVLAPFLPAGLHENLRFAREERGLNDIQAERELLNTSHAEVGGIVAQHWNLPESMVTGITYHHAPQEAPMRGHELVAWVTHLSDLVARAVVDPSRDRELPPDLRLTVGQAVRLKPSGFGGLCADVEERLEEVMSLYL